MVRGKKPFYDVYIGRAEPRARPPLRRSKWANPFPVRKFGLDSCLELYKSFLFESGLINNIEELRGKVLGCWCKPNKCHGDILIELLKDDEFEVSDVEYTSVCPECQEEVPDEEIYNCEMCGKIMCPRCLGEHVDKHHK